MILILGYVATLVNFKTTLKLGDNEGKAEVPTEQNLIICFDVFTCPFTSAMGRTCTLALVLQSVNRTSMSLSFIHFRTCFL